MPCLINSDRHLISQMEKTEPMCNTKNFLKMQYVKIFEASLKEVRFKNSCRQGTSECEFSGRQRPMTSLPVIQPKTSSVGITLDKRRTFLPWNIGLRAHKHLSDPAYLVGGSSMRPGGLSFQSFSVLVALEIFLERKLRAWISSPIALYD